MTYEPPAKQMNFGTMTTGASTSVQHKPVDQQLIEGFSEIVQKTNHVFTKVDSQTGRIQGSSSSPQKGKHNEIGVVGRVILDRYLNGIWSTNAEPFTTSVAAQDYDGIRKECLKGKKLWEDPAFPADSTSLTNDAKDQTVVWMRPWQIVSEPRLFSEGEKRFEVVQGALGNCWFLVGAMCLTLNEGLFYQIVLPDQSFSENYTGAFHFRIWNFGQWVDVVIDDRLPTVHGQLLYAHSEPQAVFWVALLEKATAKLKGSYESLNSGLPCNSMVDFSGGISEQIFLDEQHENLYSVLMKAYASGALIACTIDRGDPRTVNLITDDGLVRGHAYAVTRVRKVNDIEMIRLRNPWGDNTTWTGPYGNNRVEWDTVSQQEKEEIRLSFAETGEFWMPFAIYVKKFNRIELCHLGPKTMETIHAMTGANIETVRWLYFEQKGEWRKGETAGGRPSRDLDTYYKNPQYLLVISDSDTPAWEDVYTCVISLMQKERRGRDAEAETMVSMAFDLYKLDAADGKKKERLTQQKFLTLDSYASPRHFLAIRETAIHVKMGPGYYVLIPCTYDPEQEGEYLIRIFTESDLEVIKL